MGRHFTHTETKGFTIIETMLVLAITGMLVAGLLVGLGSSIGIQRYKDSVATLKSQIQSQYSQIDNVTNSRDGSWTCGAAATPVQGGGGKQPGQTDCVVLGRYMSISGSNIVTTSVVGYSTTSVSAANDVASIKANYTLGIAKDTIQNTTLEWGSEIGWPVTGPDSKAKGTPRAISMLILRSPNSGTTYTFTTDAAPDINSVSSSTLLNMMVVGPTVPGQKQQTVCVNPSGDTVGIPATVPEKSAIYISQAANGPSSIESRTNDTTNTLAGSDSTTPRSKC